MKRRMMSRKKEYKGLKPWSLLFDLNGFTHELISPQTNDILLITWGQTMGQDVLKFLMVINLKFFWP
jgi:hypothetical protein